jgi:hypothetical protein
MWIWLQVGSQTAASKENIEDQRKADEEKKLFGTVSALSRWKVGGQTDGKRRELFVFVVVDFVVDISHAAVHCDKGSTKCVLCNSYLSWQDHVALVLDE